MALEESILSMILAVGFVAWILFVIFGQVTVRKLRKKPETRHELGVEFASGWDIFNVAQALTLPKSVMKKIRKNPQGAVCFLQAMSCCMSTQRYLTGCWHVCSIYCSLFLGLV